jgi:putative ABC transport system permease protein
MNSRVGSMEFEETQLSQITVQVASIDMVKPTHPIIEAAVRPYHALKKDVDIIVPYDLLLAAQQTARQFSIILGTIASISLLVGGIGIMNIMLASVLERTREIGVRRAIGARRTDIIRQFVMETTMIAVAGGTLGLMLGASMSRLIASFAGWSTIISSGSLALAFSVSVLIGLVSGVYPAMKASRLDPVQALHYE